MNTDLGKTEPDTAMAPLNLCSLSAAPGPMAWPAFHPRSASARILDNSAWRVMRNEINFFHFPETVIGSDMDTRPTLISETQS